MLFFANLFWFVHDLTRLLQRIENICYLFILMGFIVTFSFAIQSGESIYDPRDEHNQIQARYLSLIRSYFILDIY